MKPPITTQTTLADITDTCATSPKSCPNQEAAIQETTHFPSPTTRNYDYEPRSIPNKPGLVESNFLDLFSIAWTQDI